MNRRAFSLVETLVVMAIVAILALLSVPAFETVMKGSRVTIAGRSVVDDLSMAQQTALSRNLPVEFRLYKLPNELNPSGPRVYRAFQTFLSGDTATPLTKVIFFPPGIAVMEDRSTSGSPKSPLFANPGALTEPVPKPGTEGISLPKYGTDYEFVSFRFKANGETDLNNVPQGAFFTLVTLTDVKADGGLPANFVTIQIDPLNGRVRTFRP